MKNDTLSVQELRRELRGAIGDRGRLMKLNSLVTNFINHQNTFGEEKSALLEFRQEVKDALNCRVM